MKLKCKIKDKYMKQILEGKKKVEYRQVESITFVDEQGKEYEFEVKTIGAGKTMTQRKAMLFYLMERYPDIPWKYDIPTLAIRLGRRIK